MFLYLCRQSSRGGWSATCDSVDCLAHQIGVAIVTGPLFDEVDIDGGERNFMTPYLNDMIKWQILYSGVALGPLCR